MTNIIISKKLKVYRYQNRMTQKDLADLFGMTSQAISKWEREECYPDITLLPIIADAIGCKIDDFFV